MATSYTPLGYCTEEDIENFLLLDIDSSFSSQVSTWITSAEKWINNYCGYTTASGLLRESIADEIVPGRIDSDLNLVVFPRKTPIVSVSAIALIKGTSSVTLGLTSGSTNRYNIPTTADYIYYPQAELSISGASIISSFAELKGQRFFCQTSYIAGYNPLPADVHLATVNIVADYIMRHANKEGLQSITQGRVAKTWYQRKGGESDFVQDAKLLLAPYRMGAHWA